MQLVQGACCGVADVSHGELSERIGCCCNTRAPLQVGRCQELTLETSTFHYSATRGNKAASRLAKIISFSVASNQLI